MNDNIPTADVEILGGTDTATAMPVADETADATPVAATPGKAAARKHNSEKRDYTPRGTTYWARRVILLNGAPVGRGRPEKAGKGERKVVYVPVGMDYDVAVHGEGVKYNTHSHRATHKRIAKDSVTYTFDDGVSPTKDKATKATKAKGNAKATKATATKATATKAKGKTVTKAKGNAKTTKAKGKTAKRKSVSVPVADVVATTEVPTAEVVTSTEAVVA